MTTFKEGYHPKRIIDVIADRPSLSASTKKTYRREAENVLEALIAEFGIEHTLIALKNQGYVAKSYKSLLKRLYEEAESRRQHFQEHKNSSSK